VRLKRHGTRNELGLGSFVFKGKAYRRAGIYRVDAALRRYLMDTGKFETILDEDLPKAKKEAKEPRGQVLGTPGSAGTRNRTVRGPKTVTEADGVESVDVDSPEAESEDDEGGIAV
jgi:hypothetical protein